MEYKDFKHLPSYRIFNPSDYLHQEYAEVHTKEGDTLVRKVTSVLGLLENGLNNYELLCCSESSLDTTKEHYHLPEYNKVERLPIEKIVFYGKLKLSKSQKSSKNKF